MTASVVNKQQLGSNVSGTSFTISGYVLVPDLPPPIVDEVSIYESTSASNTHSIPVPSGTTEGDLLIQMVAVRALGGSGRAWDSSLTEFGFVADASSSEYLAVAYKIAGASEPASYTYKVHTSSTRNIVAYSFRISGYDTSNPVGDSVQTFDMTTSSTIHSAPSVTPDVDNTLVFYAIANDDTSVHPEDQNNPSGTTLIGAKASGDASSNVFGGLAYKQVGLAAPSGVGNWTSTSAGLSVLLSFSVNPGLGEGTGTPSFSQIIDATSPSNAAILAAVAQVTQDNALVRVPAGAGSGNAITLSSSFSFHLAGPDWLAGPSAYTAAIDDMKAKAELVHDATISAGDRAGTFATFEAAFEAFLPSVTNLNLILASDNITVSRLGLVGLTTTATDYCVHWCRMNGDVSENNVDLESSHLGDGLIAECVIDEAVVSLSARTNDANNSQTFWNNIPVNPGGSDMPYIQDTIVKIRLVPGAGGGETVGQAAVDPTWHGGKGCMRNCVFFHGSSEVAAVRVHGFYLIGGGCSRVNSSRYLELLDILLINDSNVGWRAIEATGGAGTVVNFRNTYKGGTLYIKNEAISRNGSCNPLGCSSSGYPRTQQIAGSPHDIGWYFDEIYHKGTLLTGPSDTGITQQCSALMQHGRDWFLAARPGFVPRGTHTLASKMVAIPQ